MIGPRAHLVATGELSAAGIALLYRSVWAVAVSHNFPPPSGYGSWNEPSAPEEVAHDFLTGPKGLGRLTDLALRSVDEASFRRMLEAAVHNHLRDRARETDLGKVILRVTRLMKLDDRFSAAAGGRWCLAGADVIGASAVPATDLERAIAAVPVAVPRWNSESRDAPIADGATLGRLIELILQEAHGSLTARDIAQVLASRLDIRRTALSIDLDTLLGSGRDVIGGSAELPGDVVGSMTAGALFGALSDRERIVLAHPELTIRELAKVIDLRPSQTAVVRQRLVARLQEEFNDLDLLGETMTELCDLCEEWLFERTAALDATSEGTVGKEAR